MALTEGRRETLLSAWGTGGSGVAVGRAKFVAEEESISSASSEAHRPASQSHPEGAVGMEASSA